MEVYEKEALAMVYGVTTFRPDVFGSSFKIITDHKPLLRFKTAELNTRVQKWRFKLTEYDYSLVYKPGRQNASADALSCNPTETAKINFLTRAKRATNKLKNHNIRRDTPKKPKPVAPTPRGKAYSRNDEEGDQRYSKRTANRPNYAESEITVGTEIEGQAREPIPQESAQSELDSEAAPVRENAKIGIANDSASSASSNSSSNTSEATTKGPRCHIVKSQEQIQYGTGNVAIFVRTDG